MKVRIKRSFFTGQKCFKIGDTAEIPEGKTLSDLLARGFAEPAEKPKTKKSKKDSSSESQRANS